jgi:hypothetical protein
MEGLLQDLSGVLRLAAITCEALLGCEAATLSDFRVFFDGSGHGGHGALLASVGSVAVAVRPSTRARCPRASVSTVSLLRHALFALPAFFCHLSAVYIRPSGLTNSHTVFCTPHQHREGWR